MFEPKHISFDREKGTLLLNINEKDVSVPDYIEAVAKKEGLEKKEELHLTVIGFGLGQKILNASSKEALDNLEKLINEIEWSISLTKDFYKIQKTYTKDNLTEERTTIIQMANVSDLEDFFLRLNELTGLKIEIPPSHLTLYSKSTIPENMLAGIGISSEADFKKLKPSRLVEETNNKIKYKSIALPTRPQPDTIVAIFILQHYGSKFFPAIEKADYIFIPRLEAGETEETMRKKGIMLFDIGGGDFDHHNKPIQTSASALIAEYLGEKNNPALAKLLQYAERDDFYGKGIISNDPLDRAFGLSGLIGSLNKKYVNEPETVIKIVLPLLDAFLLEEEKRAFEMPKEVEEKISSGKAQILNIYQRNKHLKCIYIQTDNVSMAGYLRSKGGGGYDVVILRLNTGHINILTRPLQKVDLRSLAVLIRLQEAEAQGKKVEGDPATLSIPGSLKEVPEWFYDPATNSLLNGGPNPQNVKATSIDPFELTKLLELGLSEKLWRP
jgi:hypothetical protein